jgi:hypothetical protein
MQNYADDYSRYFRALDAIPTVSDPASEAEA